MTKPGIHIERLQVRLRGVTADRARALAPGLAGELARQLAGRGLPAGRIGEVDAGLLRPPAGADAAELRRGIAARIAAGIVAGEEG